MSQKRETERARSHKLQYKQSLVYSSQQKEKVLFSKKKDRHKIMHAETYNNGKKVKNIENQNSA